MITAAEHFISPRSTTLIAPPIQEEAREQVRSLLMGIYPMHVATERRAEQRHPFPRLCLLTPVASDGLPIGQPMTAAGKHISETGLSFFHPQPLPYRWVVVSLPRSDGRWIDLVLNLDWCRFTRQGWYESGGRFVRCAPKPTTEFVSSNALEPGR